jgi:sugar transferase (PEP-CTERM/EpsH1 system associated)
VELLYLSHCVPNPPDKGEKIRAHFELNELARRHKVHLACFARSPEEMEEARKLVDRCASVYVAPLFPFGLHMARAGLRFAGGACLNTAFYDSAGMRADIAELLKRRRVRAAVSYTAVMAPYVPAGLPFVLDLTDVDSEKWRQYAAERKPGFLFGLEAARMRRLEREQAARAHVTLLTTRAEETLFRSFAPEARTAVLENGVDFAYFDPAGVREDGGLSGRRYLLFVGSMDYYPNQRAVIDFVDRVLPAVRAQEPELELLVVGRKPPARVLALAREPGVDVVGTVDDVRPYYRWAKAVVAPLSIARGIQNKVLEGLAMDKPVLASEAVCRTFGEPLPAGVKRCVSAADYGTLPEAAEIRRSARKRFSWKSNLEVLTEAVERAAAGR